MNKKAIGLALTTVLTVSMLSACSSKKDEAGTSTAPSPTSGTGTTAPASDLKGKIKVLTHRTDLVNDGTMKKYADKFKEKYPNATVEFEGLTNYATDIKVRLTTGEAGDVNMLDGGMPTSELPSYYEPLPDSLFENTYFADYRELDGKRYGITTGVNTQGIVYNKKAFTKAGIDKVPTTLDELYAAADKLKAAGVTPLYMNFGAQWPMTNWGQNSYWYLSGNAKYTDTLVSTDTPFTVDGPYGQLINIARHFVEKGWVEKDLNTNNWEMSKGDIASGKAAMYALGNWVIPQVIGAGAASEDIGFFPLPYDNSGKYNAPLGGDYFIGVSKDSKNKELATAWVEFFVKESGYDTDSGFLPVDKTKKSEVAQMSEFQSYDPNFIESVATDPKFNEIANKAQIQVSTGAAEQELVLAPDLQKAFDAMNKKWAAARKELGY